MNLDTIILIVFLVFFIPAFWAFGKAFSQKESAGNFAILKGPMDRRYLWIIVPCFIAMFIIVIGVNVLLMLGSIEFGK